MATTMEGDDRVIATAQRIVKSLGSNKDITKDMILILSNFDNRLSTMSELMDHTTTTNSSSKNNRGCGGRESTDSRDSPSLAHSSELLILRWHSNSQDSLPWEDSPAAAAEYLSAVDDLLRLTDRLSLSASGDGDASSALDHAESLLQLAMSRLEDEFRLLLSRNTVPLDSSSLRRGPSLSLSFASDSSLSVSALPDDFESSLDDKRDPSIAPRRDHIADDDPPNHNHSSSSALPLDLIHPDAVQDLQMIADRMLRSGYEKECCQAYSGVRRDVLDECLLVLGVDKVGIEEVHRMDWRALDERMKRWAHAVEIVVCVLLPGEKRLCDQVFGPSSDLIREVCFAETAKGCVLQILSFGEAIAIGHHSPEKLFRILNMYDALSGTLPDLRALFPDESGDFLRAEAEGILKGLGDAARGTFTEFGSAVQRETSRKPMQGCEIHPMTRYVMNYVRLLVDYSASLNALLSEEACSGDAARPSNSGTDDSQYLDDISPLGRRLVTLIASLESNLEEKSKLYEDIAMQYVFLTNNIYYIIQKVKDSELRTLLGDHWVRKRRGQVRQYATSYLRASWGKALSCLKDEGLGGSGSSSNVSKLALKERFKNFNAAFEEIYRNQTVWKVPDLQLREELRLSVSDKVIPAYRSFMGRFGSQLESVRHAGKYIKYTPDDIEKLLLDLFEGLPGQLSHPRKKLSM